MSDRFSKGTDISQLISLIERAVSEDEREALLGQIERDDPGKASLLRARALTVEKIYSLDDETLGRILEDIEDSVFSDSLRNLDIELRQRALKMVNGERRNAALRGLRRTDVSLAQISSSKRQLIQKARELEKAGRVHFGSVVRTSTFRRAA